MYLQFEDRHYKLMESWLDRVFGIVGRVQHSDGFQGNMPAYSLGLSAVYVGTFKKGYACLLQIQYWVGAYM